MATCSTATMITAVRPMLNHQSRHLAVDSATKMLASCQTSSCPTPPASSADCTAMDARNAFAGGATAPGRDAVTTPPAPSSNATW